MLTLQQCKALNVRFLLTLDTLYPKRKAFEVLLLETLNKTIHIFGLYFLYFIRGYSRGVPVQCCVIWTVLNLTDLIGGRAVERVHSGWVREPSATQTHIMRHK